MRYRAAIVFIAATACSEDAPPAFVRIEHQPKRADATIGTDWVKGSGIEIVDDAAVFPRPVTFRFSVVDETATWVGVGRFSARPYGASLLQYIKGECERRLPDVAADWCWMDFDVIGLGSNVFVVDVDSPHPARDCIYYAVLDASADIDALRDELEAKVQGCRASGD
jgi:hypothetical protein